MDSRQLLIRLDEKVPVVKEFTLQQLLSEEEILSYISAARRHLADYKCVLTLSQGIRGISNLYKRLFEPTRENPDVCKGCPVIEGGKYGTSGCPINERARRK